MKPLLAVVCILMPLYFAACANNNNSNDNTIATVPPPTCADGSTNCNPNQYPTYMYGSSYYGSYCNCPPGSRPVYNGAFGMGCLAISGSNNGQWVNLGQISNTQGYPNTGCYQKHAASCLVDRPNSCGVGATCQATGGGSRIGVCVTAGTQYSDHMPTTGGYR